ncbi:MAG: O-antigen ligase family protein, partial [Pseudomonadales bacterium]
LHLLLLCGLGLAMLFYGVGYNHLFLLGSSLCAVTSLTLLGPQLFLRTLHQRPVSVGLALLMLLALAMHQLLFSISAETSFSPSWILAAAPLWFLVVLLMTESTPRFLAPFLLVLLIAALLMLISAVRFLGFGTRPYDPLADVSGYGAFLYLALVPALHYWLCGSPLRSIKTAAEYWRTGLVVALVLLTCVVIVATASRACIGLMGLALAVWLLLGLLGRVNLERVVLMIGVAVVALVLTSISSNAVQTTMSESLEQDAAMDQRLLLADAGVSLARAHAPWGGGVFTFALQYPSVRSTEDQTSAGRYVHNDYLQLAAEGGALLLLPLALIALGVVRGNWQTLMPGGSLARGPCDPYAGGWLALALVMLHALVNFVFYTLALGVMVGILAAWAVPGRLGKGAARAAPVQPKSRFQSGLWLLAISFGWVNVAYLALDNTNLAVFSGQPGLPGVAVWRASAEQQQTYARISARLNEDRSLPHLVIALYGKQRLEQQSGAVSAAQIESGLQRALTENPWNTKAYIEYADLLLQQGQRQETVGESQSQALALLDQALRHAPADLDVLSVKAKILEEREGAQAALALLMTDAFPWLENYWILSSKRANGLIEELGRRALALDDQRAFAKVRDARAELMARNTPEPLPAVWFMRWQQARQSR